MHLSLSYYVIYKRNKKQRKKKTTLTTQMGETIPKNSPPFCLKISRYLQVGGTQGVSQGRASNLDARLYKGAVKTRQ